MPELDFSVEQAEVLPFAAAPSLLFKLYIENRTGEPVRSIMLRVQLQIATAQRAYNSQEQARLVEVFGQATRWGTTLKPLLWTHAVVLVPPFTNTTVVDIPVPCTYDFDVVSAKYFHALEDGEIPLEFLFSGTIFYRSGVGLQAAQIAWEKEAKFRLPVQLWQAMMEHYFPDSAWLRLRKDIFDRLYRYKSARALPTWEAALAELLPPGES